LGGLLPPKAPIRQVHKLKTTSKNTNNLLITSTESSFSQPANPPHWPQDSEWVIDTCTLSIPVTSGVPELANNTWNQTEGKQNEKHETENIQRLIYESVRLSSRQANSKSHPWELNPALRRPAPYRGGRWGAYSLSHFSMSLGGEK
jgi:hypothetical protein